METVISSDHWWWMLNANFVSSQQIQNRMGFIFLFETREVPVVIDWKNGKVKRPEDLIPSPTPISSSRILMYFKCLYW